MSVEVELERQPHERPAGEVLANRYQIVSKIGEGAMGAVYRAKHVKVGRAFAVKVLHPRLLEDNKVMQRFEREAELAGRLRHPNVIGVIDVGETTDGMRYMVMDFAEGPDLATLLSEAPMTPQRVALLTRQMLEGLYHAHEAGLIHRDFKPENVIIEKDTHGHEVPRIVDFGIAILREGGDSTAGPGRLTTNGLVLGTPHYMAPEQAVADPIDHRIDLFALGIIVYEMLCGKLPFDGSGAEVARANLLLDPPPISQRVPYLEVDPLLEAFARRLMAKKRDHRPATAKAARDLLELVERDREAAAAALGVPLAIARREPMSTQPQTPVRQHTGNETFPPPLRGAPQAPPMTTPKAVAAVAQDKPLTTQQTELRKRRAPLIAAAVAGLGVLGGAAYVIMNGDNKANPTEVAATPEPSVTPIETQPTPPPVEPTRAEVVAPVEQPKVDDTKLDDTKLDDTKLDDTKLDDTKLDDTKIDDTKAGSTATEPKAPKPAKATPKPAKATPKTTKPTPNTPKTNATPKANATANSTNATTTPANPTTTKVEPKPEPKVVTSQMLASQYQSVGSQLKALQEAKGQDAVTDLWGRYRMIRLVDAMRSQPMRDEAAATLSKLASEIAARKK